MLIINADDFGYSSEVNAAIAQAFAEKLISSTTIMANMPGFVEACAIARKMALVSHVGIHLNLTQGKALSSRICAFPGLCRANGELCFKRESRILLSPGEIGALQAEVKAQIERCRAEGLPLSHADSHHHALSEVPVLLSVAPVLRRAGIAYLRLSDNVRPVSRLRAIYKAGFNALHGVLGLRRVDYFTDMANVGRLGDRLTRGGIVVEIMVHPVFGANGALVDAGMKMPLADLVHALPRGYDLGSYADIGGARQRMKPA